VDNIFRNYKEERKIEVSANKFEENIIKRRVVNIKQIIFEVTQICNLRCKYCIYGNAFYNYRNHSTLQMPFEIALKGMQYIYDLTKRREDKELFISIYGGEPLTNFQLIKRIVKESKKIFENFNLRYSITTNGTMLIKKIIDYLVLNNFSIQISLDGPEDMNDANRLFSDGKGTYAKVMFNIDKFKSYYKNYFFNKVGINSTFSWNLSLRKRYEFFIDTPVINKMRFDDSNVIDRNTTYYQAKPINKSQIKKDIDYIFDNIINKLKQKIKLTPYEELFLNSIESVSRSLSIKKWNCKSGTCIFDSKVFIDAEGRFHVCERIDDKMPIGDVYIGFNYDKMENIFNNFKRIIMENCKNCCVRFFCHICYANIASSGKFVLNNDFCGSQKRAFKRRMEMYIRLKEGDLI
ncbi:MAG: radical SAM protein, partial [Candidatus Hermodarchaeota archaeon]